MLLLPYAIFRAAHVHIGRRVVGVARLAIPITHRRLGRTPSCTCWPLRRRSIQVQVQSSQTPFYPSHPSCLRAGCVLCEFSLRCLARTHTVSTSIVLACVRRICGGVADGVLMQIPSLFSHSFATALFSNPIWIGCLLRPTTPPFPPAPDPLPHVASSAHATFESFPHAAPLYVC